MKRLFFLICILASVVLGANAGDYEMFIKKGLVWKEYSMPFYPDHPNHFPEYIVTYYLENEVEFDGKTVLEVRSSPLIPICCDFEGEKNNDVKTLKSYIYTEGDKVYYYPINSDVKEWHLLYDFGLEPGGEGCDVYSFDEGNNTIDALKSYVWCKNITETTVDGRTWEVMEMGEKRTSFGEEYECQNTGKWLRGLGEERGVRAPNHFDRLGGMTLLIEAIYNGEIIYSNYPAGVGQASAEALEIDVQGNQVRVLGASGRSDIYSLDGRLVGYTVDDQPVTLGNGLYIIRHGSKSSKIAI